MTTINMHMKFEVEIPKQTRLTHVTLRKPCHLQSPETKKCNMATRRPFWKRRCWKSIGSYPYTWVLCPWSLMLIFKPKVKLESGNQKNQYGRQEAILKLTSLKINRLLPMATINMHMKFEIEITKQTWLMLRKPCRLQTDGRTDRRTDWRTDVQTDKLWLTHIHTYRQGHTHRRRQNHTRKPKLASGTNSDTCVASCNSLSIFVYPGLQW